MGDLNTEMSSLEHEGWEIPGFMENQTAFAKIERFLGETLTA
jgi:hypothetical protein